MAPGSDPFRIAIVGEGFGRRVLLPAFQKDPRWQIAAVTSRAWRQVLDETALDAVAIAVPPRAQPEIAAAVLQRRLALFCEKPLAASLDEAERLVANAPAGVPAMVDFEFPEIGCWKEALARVASGSIGSLREISVVWSVSPRANAAPSTWKTDFDRGGGALQSFASHSLYYLERFAGPVTRLSASLFRQSDGTADTLAVLLLEHGSGVVSSVRISSQAFCSSEHRVELFGSTGRLMLLNESRDYVSGFRLLDCGNEIASPEPKNDSSDGRIDAIAGIARRLADWLETGEPQRPSLGDGLRVQQLIESVKMAAEQGTRVEV